MEARVRMQNAEFDDFEEEVDDDDFFSDELGNFTDSMCDFKDK